VIPTKKRVPLYHVEDDEDWQIIIKEIVEGSTDLDYVPLDGTIGQVASTLKAKSGPGVALFDLRLGRPQSEFNTIVELSRLVNSLNRRNIDVYVLSGFLPEFAKPKLIDYGIAENHIFNKGTEFNRKREKFIGLLNSSVARLNDIPDSSDTKPNYHMPVCEIEAQLDAYPTGEYISMDSIKDHELRVLIRTLNIENNTNIVGAELRVSVFGDSFIASPQNFSLRVPKSGDTNSAISQIRINPTSATGAQRLLLHFYHNNHLIQQLAFDCQIP